MILIAFPLHLTNGFIYHLIQTGKRRIQARFIVDTVRRGEKAPLWMRVAIRVLGKAKK